MFIPRIIIVGATGWYGRTLLHEYIHAFGESAARENLILVASRDCQVSVWTHNGVSTFPVINLCDLLAQNLSDYHILVWYSFVLRNKIELIGSELWGATNDSIANRVFGVLELNPHLKTIFFSSGAALEWESCPEYEVDPYAALKIRYEEYLKSKGDCIVFYPYATSGEYVSDIHAFALSSFIHQAVKYGSINIKADIPVVRSYGSAHDFSKLLLKFSQHSSWENLPRAIVPVSCSLELDQLAMEVFSALNINVSIERPLVSSNRPASVYVAKSFQFGSQMREYGLKVSTLAEQILVTANRIGRA